jgi:hypothetical protein
MLAMQNGSGTQRNIPFLSTAAVTPEMQEVVGWLRFLEPVDAVIVWRRACGERWKSICWTVGLGRAAVHEHYVFALWTIASRLSGESQDAHASKRRLIAGKCFLVRPNQP